MITKTDIYRAVRSLLNKADVGLGNVDNLSAADIARQVPAPVDYSSAIPLDGKKRAAPVTISGSMTPLTMGPNPVLGADYAVTFIADGTNAVTLSSDFKKHGSSQNYINTAGTKNYLYVYYDGVDALYSWSQLAGTEALAAPVNSVAPAITTATVGQPIQYTTGAWTGNPTPTITTVFTVDGNTVASNYVPQNGDTSITVTETATNSQGIVSETSASFAIQSTAAVPDAPVISEGAKTDTTVEITYPAPANNGASITDYKLEFRTGANAFAEFADGVGTGLSITATGLTAETAYDFRLRAVNSVGDSAYSNVLSVTTDAESIPSSLVSLQFNNDPNYFTASVDGNGDHTYTASNTNNNFALFNPAMKISAGVETEIVVKYTKTRTTEPRIVLNSNPLQFNATLSASEYGIYANTSADDQTPQDYFVFENGQLNTTEGSVANMVDRDYATDDYIKFNVSAAGAVTVSVSSNGGQTYSLVHNYTDTNAVDLYLLVAVVGSGPVTIQAWMDGGVAV